ncbi:MAG TPA: acetylglutamate kinase [Elusimicrobiota bacterium]|nr:acetylglutamate kinase [Elusimicrobiota bacterium]
MRNFPDCWVIKFGGSLLNDGAVRRTFHRYLKKEVRRHPVVLVHGGGPAISAALRERGVQPKFVMGRRLTDAPTMRVVEQVLSGEVNQALVGEMNALGMNAVGLSGRDGNLLPARPVRGLGLVGEPGAAKVDVLVALLRASYIPVVSSIGFGRGFGPLNVNADEAAASLAVGLKASRLVYFTDTPGLLDSAGRTIPALRRKEIPGLIRKKVITGGMVPKVRSCAEAIGRGVGEVHILDGKRVFPLRGTKILP